MFKSKGASTYPAATAPLDIYAKGDNGEKNGDGGGLTFMVLVMMMSHPKKSNTVASVQLSTTVLKVSHLAAIRVTRWW